MKDYISGYNRDYDTFKTLSLDAPMGGTDLRRIDLLEAPAPYEREEDEEESRYRDAQGRPVLAVAPSRRHSAAVRAEALSINLYAGRCSGCSRHCSRRRV